MTYVKPIRLFDRPFLIRSDGAAITAIQPGTPVSGEWCPLLDEAKRQLTEYAAGTRTSFSLPLAPTGTAFQQTVWAVLREIPYGETRTYGEIAAAIGKPKGAQAVGMACRNNPILLMIPCHRVMGATGALTGFAAGTELKAQLLTLEKRRK